MSQQNIELVSGAQTATGQGAAKPITTATMGVLSHDITAASGTLQAWLQHSPDKGVTWFDLPYDQQLTTNAAGADLTANTNKRNIEGTAAATAVSKHTAVYKHIPAGHVRLAWVIGGATPSFTFKSVLAVK